VIDVSKRIGLRVMGSVPPRPLVTPMQFQLREHKSSGAYLPDFRFLKPSASVLRIDSYLGTFIPRGNGYLFKNFSRAWLHGKKVSVRWSMWAEFKESNNLRFEVLDGAYDRSSMTDFPDGATRPYKGSGLLALISWTTGPFDWTTVTSGVLDLSAGVLDDCCLFVWLNDYASYRKFYVDIDYVQVLSAGDIVLRSEDFLTDPVMEITGTYNDYGYISSD